MRCARFGSWCVWLTLPRSVKPTAHPSPHSSKTPHSTSQLTPLPPSTSSPLPKSNPWDSDNDDPGKKAVPLSPESKSEGKIYTCGVRESGHEGA
ncbi:hypothetical protein M427DRAFT_32148 [Gonapodya prolifera JEL478]|uniref:Uncharacterized protein n=1 Tax=Gonapodya prolifera (strain JEL478) TaxID=1344416 RepID=A0A139AG08_GONPJ|nr:hypothetical protein M427DRAFT_32148 [Gonapodya prolifera JEL478]|eukprot:KXS15727.1 hypothetical protein M427DRAFT_32148 [Gonapodya prolifera JEL478]